MEKILNYINGKLTGPVNDGWFENINPATGKAYSLIPDSGPEDVESAVQAATAAFPGWSEMPAAKRSHILIRISELIDKNLEKLAAAESTDNGKPVWLAKHVDIPRASKNFHFYATGILHNHTSAHPRRRSVLPDDRR